MASVLETQLEAMWEQAQQQKDETLTHMKDELTSNVKHQLHSVRSALHQDAAERRGAAQQKLTEVTVMLDDFEAGVQMWLARSQQLLAELRSHHEEIKGEVDVVAARLEERRKKLMEVQARRMGELARICSKRLRDCEDEVASVQEKLK